MRAAVIVFPGSNCDRDAKIALEFATGFPADMVWHSDHNLPKVDLIVIPGGFSYGDYLRVGCMAGQSPIINEVKKHAEAGVCVLGGVRTAATPVVLSRRMLFIYFFGHVHVEHNFCLLLATWFWPPSWAVAVHACAHLARLGFRI